MSLPNGPPNPGGGTPTIPKGREPSAAAVKSSRRLQNELAQLSGGLHTNITAGPTGDNLYKWTGTIQGPPASPYEGGVFLLDISIPSAYPFSPPKITFKTKIYHCNINDNGGICLDILTKGVWSPALTIASALLSVSSLLCDPNPDDPLQGAIAVLYKERREEHDRVAKEWTQRYAKPE